ncbi:MAG: hypothetical protein ACYC4U_12260 [Pirellulaceae bacterium]
MRLTLRTLLAYLDDILDPADARELGQKIEESEFASGLVHRIRSVTRKLRLGAPKLAGKGMGLDANTVAEYLDNTLPQDRVPDFEKVCLESDVQLAEVASCHQILTLVLGEPADVDPALRERIRSLSLVGDEAAQPPAVSRSLREPESDPAAPPLDTYPTQWEKAPDIPQLETTIGLPAVSGTSVRLLPVLGTVIVAFLLALAALVAIGPLDHDHPLLGRFFSDTSQIAQQQRLPGDDSASRDPRATTGDKARPGAAAEAGRPADSGTELPPVADPQVPQEDSAADPSAPLPTLPEVPATQQAAAEPEPASATQPVEPTAMDDPRLDRSQLPPEDVPADEAAPREPLAVYTSDQHVLAQWNAADDTWPRLAAHDPLEVGARLVALPTYRPQILFSGGVQVVLIGPAEAHLIGPDAEGIPGIVLHYGKFLAMSVGEANTRLNIQIGARGSRVTFADLDATLAVELQRYLPVGVDPSSREANWVCHAFAPAGLVTWEEEAGTNALPLAATELVTLVDTSEPVTQPLSQPPDWLDGRNVAPIIQAASRQLEPLLEPHRSLTVSLQEQAANRLVEVRMLAIRSLGLFGEFDPCIQALGARELRYFWKEIVESMRNVMTHSPETATKIRAAFERLRGKDGQQLDRMLWGFAPEQLADGGAHMLVDGLSSPAMDIRVLAYLNLNEITGKTNLFQPDREPRTQRRAILSWERDLQQREIVYKVPPSLPAWLAPPPEEETEGAGASNVP